MTNINDYYQTSLIKKGFSGIKLITNQITTARDQNENWLANRSRKRFLFRLFDKWYKETYQKRKVNRDNQYALFQWSNFRKKFCQQMLKIHKIKKIKQSYREKISYEMFLNEKKFDFLEKLLQMSRKASVVNEQVCQQAMLDKQTREFYLAKKYVAKWKEFYHKNKSKDYFRTTVAAPDITKKSRQSMAKYPNVRDQIPRKNWIEKLKPKIEQQQKNTVGEQAKAIKDNAYKNFYEAFKNRNAKKPKVISYHGDNTNTIDNNDNDRHDHWSFMQTNYQKPEKDQNKPFSTNSDMANSDQNNNNSNEFLLKQFEDQLKIFRNEKLYYENLHDQDPNKPYYKHALLEKQKELQQLHQNLNSC